MDYSDASLGIGSGILSSILVALGMKSRLDRIEREVVFKDTCNKCSLNSENQIKTIRESQARMEHKLDGLYDNLTRRREDIHSA